MPDWKAGMPHLRVRRSGRRAVPGRTLERGKGRNQVAASIKEQNCDRKINKIYRDKMAPYLSSFYGTVILPPESLGEGAGGAQTASAMQTSIGAEMVGVQGVAPGWKPQPVAPSNKRKRGLPLENAVFIERCQPRSSAATAPQAFQAR